MSGERLSHADAMRYATVLSFFQGFPILGTSSLVSPDEFTQAERIPYPPADWTARLGCKLCVSERGFESAPTFATPDDFLAHVNAFHVPDGKNLEFHPGLAMWPKMLQDAEACGLGYLICSSDPNDGARTFICWRCNIRVEDQTLINKRICPSCSRMYRDCYAGLRPLVSVRMPKHPPSRRAKSRQGGAS